MTVNISSNCFTVIQKISSAKSFIWQSAYAFHPLIKCLAIDKAEQSFYIVIYSNPAVIAKSDTSTGAFNSAIQM